MDGWMKILLVGSRVIFVDVGHPAEGGSRIHAGAGRTVAGIDGTSSAECRIRNALTVSCNQFKPHPS